MGKSYDPIHWHAEWLYSVEIAEMKPTGIAASNKHGKIREFLSLVQFGDIEDRKCGYLTPLVNFHLSFLSIQNHPKYKHVIPNPMMFVPKRIRLTKVLGTSSTRGILVEDQR